MRTCYHCGSLKSPCWRRGPAEKPLLCNACGAHYLVKKSLDGYMPGQRSSSVTTSSNSQHSSQHSQQRKRQRSQKLQDKQLLHGHRDTSTDVNRNLSAPPEPTGSTTSWMSASSSMEQDGIEVEQPAVVSSKKRSRLAACSVYEVDPCSASGLRCKRTFKTADGCVVTVVRRMRKQLKPRPSCSV